MSRSALLDLLPDFSSGGRRGTPPRAPGFEPLVHDADTREGFSTLGMSSGFSGITPDLELGGGQDLFPEEGMLSDFDFGDDSASLDLSGIEVGEDDFPAGLTTEAPVDLIDELQPAELEIDAASEIEAAPDFGDDGSFGSDEDYEGASGIAAHELLEAAHRAEINDIETAHRNQLEELVNSTIPQIRADVVDMITAELAPMLSDCMREAQLSKTLDALTAEIATILEDSNAVGFEVHGPEPLLAAFRDKWPEDAAPAKLVPAEGVDLVVRIDKSVIATRLSEVDRLIQEALS